MRFGSFRKSLSLTAVVLGGMLSLRMENLLGHQSTHSWGVVGIGNFLFVRKALSLSMSSSLRLVGAGCVGSWYMVSQVNFRTCPTLLMSLGTCV